jgi:hypothetical protein
MVPADSLRAQLNGELYASRMLVMLCVGDASYML